MKKIFGWLCVVIVFLSCCLCCSCGEKESTENKDLGEYYEVEYQDGSGVHIIKAIQLSKIVEIKIFEYYMEGNVGYSTEWEFNDIIYLHYYTTIDEPIGTFSACISKDPTKRNYGGLWLYYDENIEDRFTVNSNVIGSNIYAKDILVNNINLANENILINGRTLTRLSFTPDSQSEYYGHTEYCVDGYAGNDHIYFKRIRILMDFGYVDDDAKRENITLLKEGDFTTIKRGWLQDITIRSENILRKVKV